MFAIIKHLKQLHGGPAEELEKNLLKVRSQADRKMTIVEFATARKPAAPLADRSNRPSTAPTPTKPAAPAQTEVFAPPAAAAPAAPAAPAAEVVETSIQGPQRTPPRLPVPPRALLADAAALELVGAFAAGRDHASMSGSEMHGLVQWLKSKGRSEVEDLLMMYKALDQKKFQLCQYFIKHHAAVRALGGGDAPSPRVAPSPRAEGVPPLNLAATMPLPSVAATQPLAPPMQAWGEAPPQQQVQQQVQMQQQLQVQQQLQMQQQAQQAQQAQQLSQQMAMLTPRDAAGGHDAAHDRVLAQHAMMLGQTMDRMEETFNFQVVRASYG